MVLKREAHAGTSVKTKIHKYWRDSNTVPFFLWLYGRLRLYFLPIFLLGCARTWRLEANLVMLVLSFHHVGIPGIKLRSSGLALRTPTL